MTSLSYLETSDINYPVTRRHTSATAFRRATVVGRVVPSPRGSGPKGAAKGGAKVNTLNEKKIHFL